MKKLLSIGLALALSCIGVASAYAAPPGGTDYPQAAVATVAVQAPAALAAADAKTVAPSMSIFSTSNLGAKPEVLVAHRSLIGAGSADLAKAINPMQLQPGRWRT